MMRSAPEPRAFGPRAADPTPRGAGGTRRGSSPAMGAVATRGGDARREDGLGLLGAVVAELVAVPAILLGAIALYVALIAPPLLALLPIALMGLLINAIGSVWGALA
jgi:hypothetical protein